MQHDTDIAGRNPGRHLRPISPTNKTDDIRQSLLLNKLFERLPRLAFSHQQERGRGDLLTYERHGFDQRLQPMPGKESADKSDIGAIWQKVRGLFWQTPAIEDGSGLRRLHCE